MGNRPRRRGRHGRRFAPLRPASPAAPWGCPHLAVIDFDAMCDGCGERVRDQVILPTPGQPGDTREIGASCPCGGQAVGTGVVVEILPG